MPRRPAPPEGFRVAGWMDWLGERIASNPQRWIALGNFETRTVAERIQNVEITRPIYIAGLARSGTTILLEKLAAHPVVATHRYRDDPPVFIPYWWNRWLDYIPRGRARPVERSHRDGIRVTPDSPEAFEEALWMAFFPQLHDPAHSAVLDRRSDHHAFERFYRDHIRKLLAARRRSRYVAKGNYNLTRLGYLHELFQDARFLIPVRDPAWHIASLMKQHRLFLQGQRDNPRAVRHLRRIGHFEFGVDRRPINPGAPQAVADVQALWAAGEEVAGWAAYWALLHGYVADLLASDPALAAATRVVRYEALCAAPVATLTDVFEFCGLPAEPAWVESIAADLKAPDYYQPQFTAAERAQIAARTGAVARRFGYDVALN